MMKYIYQAVRNHDYDQLLGLRPWRRHLVVLAGAGVVYMVYGATLIWVNAPPTRSASLSIALSWMSMGTWGVVWIAVGTLAFASTRWPPASETWGYSAMSGMAALWSLFYAMSVIFKNAPMSGIAGTLVWGLMAFPSRNGIL